jgi:hypothetical protein
MKEGIRFWKIGIGLIISALALAACGGGGGGGGGGSDVPASYTGERSQATITDANAETIVIGAWMGGTLGRDIGNITPAQTAETASGVLGLARALKTPILQSIPAGTTAIRPTDTFPPEPGPCGGEATVTINSESSTSFSGQILFDGYCDEGTTLTGTVPFSGTLNPNIGEGVATELKLTFSDLRVTTATEDVTLNNGTAKFTLNIQNSVPVGETDNLDYVLTNLATSKTYYVDHYVANLTYGSGSSQATLQGRYYDYDYGYVNISTVTALTIPDTDTQPTGGTLLFTGNNSQARLTFNSDGSTTIELSTGGGPFVPI